MVGLALVAGGAAGVAMTLGLGMLGLQLAIGAANDWFDVDLDERAKPGKPIPAGLVSRRTAAVVAASCGGGGLLLSASVGPVPVALAAIMLGAGLAYDARLKRTSYGWVCFAVAFPLLPVYAWYGAVVMLPPRPELLLPVAALAGPTLQLANGLVDIDRDASVGVIGLAGRLGRRGTLIAMALLHVVINGLAWATVLVDPSVSGAARFVVIVATAVTAAGLVLSASADPERREWGWRCQATAIALLAIGWLTAFS